MSTLQAVKSEFLGIKNAPGWARLDECVISSLNLVWRAFLGRFCGCQGRNSWIRCALSFISPPRPVVAVQAHRPPHTIVCSSASNCARSSSCKLLRSPRADKLFKVSFNFIRRSEILCIGVTVSINSESVCSTIRRVSKP